MTIGTVPMTVKISVCTTCVVTGDDDIHFF